MINTKKCTSCKQILPITEFTIYGKNYRRAKCKKCQREYNNKIDKQRRNQKKPHKNASIKRIKYIYNLSEVLSLIYNKHQVDHIIPLSKNGTHHEDNLQILTREENLRKSNKLDTTISGIRWTDIERNKSYYDTLVRILHDV